MDREVGMALEGMAGCPLRLAFRWPMASRAKFDSRRGVRPCIRRHRSLDFAPSSHVRKVRSGYLRQDDRIGDALLSEDVFDEHFACDLTACKGACCVEGDSGAPLTQAEVGQLEMAWEHVAPLLPEKGRQAVEAQGLAVTDSDGDLVTPLVEGKECAYTVFDADGTAKCGLEQAYFAGKTQWRKPLSCHLYPIRAKELIDFTALNYHRWPICEAARLCGKAGKMSVLDFCKDASDSEVWGTVVRRSASSPSVVARIQNAHDRPVQARRMCGLDGMLFGRVGRRLLPNRLSRRASTLLCWGWIPIRFIWPLRQPKRRCTNPCFNAGRCMVHRERAGR